MDANELKKQIDCMEKQVDNLDHQLFQMRSELSKRVFGMDTVDIVAMANRMNDLEERIVVGEQKVAMAKRIHRHIFCRSLDTIRIARKSNKRKTLRRSQKPPGRLGGDGTMQDMGIWNAPPSPKRPHGRMRGRAGSGLSCSTTTTTPSLPRASTFWPGRGARIPRRASLPTQEGKEQPWS